MNANTKIIPNLLRDSAAHDECYRVAKYWLEQCSRHPACGPLNNVPLPTRLLFIPPRIDQAPFLQTTEGRAGKYVAFSHCWGTKRIIGITTSLTILGYQARIQTSSLPPNFQDAIKITRNLGFLYLWIDALCIIQDSASDWEREAARMASVYGNASLVISASAAIDSQQGMLIQREIATSPAFGPGKKVYFQHARTQQLKGPDSFDSHLRILDALGDAPISSRAWTLQERVLASRILHYADCQLIWECNQTCYFEAYGRHDSVDLTTGSNRYDGGYRKSNMSRLLSTAFSGDGQNDLSILGADHTDVAGGSWDRFDAWYICMEEYSKRALTVASDKLPGISGLATIFCSREFGSYCAGIWSGDLARGLSWHMSEPVTVQQENYYRAPSWSWAAYDAPVRELDIARSGRKLERTLDQMAWAALEGLALIEDGMIRFSQARAPYGRVSEGSYIVIEGLCYNISQQTLGELTLQAIQEAQSADGHYHPPKKRPKVYWDTLSALNNFLVEFGGIATNRTTHEIVCLLLADQNYDRTNRVALLLEATNHESTTFWRLGIVHGHLNMLSQSWESDFLGLRSWERRRLKMI
jgi:hypothetical protein